MVPDICLKSFPVPLVFAADILCGLFGFFIHALVKGLLSPAAGGPDFTFRRLYLPVKTGGDILPAGPDH